MNFKKMNTIGVGGIQEMDSSLIMSEIESSQVTDHNVSKSSIDESHRKKPHATKNPFLDPLGLILRTWHPLLGSLLSDPGLLIRALPASRELL